MRGLTPVARIIYIYISICIPISTYLDIYRTLPFSLSIHDYYLPWGGRSPAGRARLDAGGENDIYLYRSISIYIYIYTSRYLESYLSASVSPYIVITYLRVVVAGHATECARLNAGGEESIDLDLYVCVYLHI